MILSLGVWNATLRHGQSTVEARSQRLSSAVRLLETNASQQVPLADGSGRLIAVAVMQDDRTVSLVVDGLPRNDRATSTYVLWQTGDSGTRPVGTFDVTGSGVSLVRKLRLSPGLVGWNAFAITRESGRRAPAAPGSLPVANGSLRA